MTIINKHLVKPWSFEDEYVVKNFSAIAKSNIPDYEEIILICLDIANKFLTKNSRIIDIGSALGYTLEHFYKAGYSNLVGLEASKAMINESFNKATLIHSSKIETHYGKFDFVLANWVLHFNEERQLFLKSIFESMNTDGIFIISEKIKSSFEIHELYLDFKKKNGLNQQEIETKAAQIKDVLIPYELEWYLETLKEIGFQEINIIKASFSFVTIYCRKRVTI